MCVIGKLLWFKKTIAFGNLEYKHNAYVDFKVICGLE